MPSFTIYEDSTAGLPPISPSSPLSVASDTCCALPDPDEPIASIEHGGPPTSASPSRRVSAALTSCASIISSMPASLVGGGGGGGGGGCDENNDRGDNTNSSPFTPMKERLLFRSPGSVRALQMASPPPFEPRYNSVASPPNSHGKRYKLTAPPPAPPGPSRNGTPRSVQSQSVITNGSGAKMHGSPRQACLTSGRDHEKLPLVLLHATLLPLVCPWSPENMEEILPKHVLDKFKLLAEKMTDNVMARGILIRHPKEEYDVLEERLLESLELKTPRILKCGHWYGEEDEDPIDSAYGDSESGRHEYHDYDEDNSDSECGTPCGDCGKPFKVDSWGVEGRKRWDIKIYAANGLMRAGAWSAAWSEMERVDVEIAPWIPDDLRRKLDEKTQAEEAEARKMADERESRRLEEERQAREQREMEAARRLGEERRARERREAEEAERRAQASVERSPSAEPQVDPLLRNSHGSSEGPEHIIEGLDRTLPRVGRNGGEIPLGTLVQNYLYLLSQDRRNVAIFALSLLVLVLAMISGAPSVTSPVYDGSVSPDLLDDLDIQCAAAPHSTAVYTTTTTVVTTAVPSALASDAESAATMAASSKLPLMQGYRAESPADMHDALASSSAIPESFPNGAHDVSGQTDVDKRTREGPEPELEPEAERDAADAGEVSLPEKPVTASAVAHESSGGGS
ncbi:hypothetical protein BDY21DRAFT_359923 [Lineolata rhizophorae]|uniref:Pathway-specific nitrogen regulator n=1 Tax=Lineolata rhizophorae TaxID=578093 RepID=A0A6A6PDG7_9PEZI|nr:hypothetical protein BDY21DRAFT_359923 [Lineolata rhizophorae]